MKRWNSVCVACVLGGMVASAGAQVTLLTDQRRIETGASAQAAGALNTKYDAQLPSVLYDFWPGASASSATVTGASGSATANQDSTITPTFMSAVGDVSARGTLSGTAFGTGTGKSTFAVTFHVDQWVEVSLTGALGVSATRSRQEVTLAFSDGSPVYRQTTNGDVVHGGRLSPGTYSLTAMSLADQTTGAGRGFIGRGNFDITAGFTPTAPCIGDFDLSGGVPDSADVDAFFQSWLTGSDRADVDLSGGVPDTVDIQVFFNSWLAGC